MGNSFTTNKINQNDQTILQLKIQRDKLKMYQKNIERTIIQHIQVAKEHIKKDQKSRALTCLKMKKHQETLLIKIDDQILNLEQLVWFINKGLQVYKTQSIETAIIEKQLYSSLELGNKLLKDIHNELSLEKVEKLMDETADAVAYQNEIENTLAGQFTDDQNQDIENELDALLFAEKDRLEDLVVPNNPLHNNPVINTNTNIRDEDIATLNREI